MSVDIPPFTCPLIDALIEATKPRKLDVDWNGLRYTDISEALEALREANDSLREAMNDAEEQAEEAEYRCAELTDEVEELKGAVEDLEQANRELLERIDALTETTTDPQVEPCVALSEATA